MMRGMYKILMVMAGIAAAGALAWMMIFGMDYDNGEPDGILVKAMHTNGMMS